MRKILIDVLGKAGITDVAQAADGAEAVKAATAEDFGLILMDWNMPNMLGIDALKAIRATGKSTPVIMVTTEAEKSRVLEAIKAGANNYIIKPFVPSTIMAKIQDVLAKAAS
jgi:two-component system chemotaxis response regulator CheY